MSYILRRSGKKTPSSDDKTQVTNVKCVVEKLSGFPENTAKIIDNIVMEMQVGREIFIHTVDMYHE